MKEKEIVAINTLLLFSTIFILYGICMIPRYLAEKEEAKVSYTPKDFGSAPRLTQEPSIRVKRQPNPNIVKEAELRNEWQEVVVTYQTIHTEYLGRYFLTAYSDEETYSRATASGVEVHYSEDPYEPTTCAIDRRYHQFGDLFMIDGKIYVAEDTGAFSGLWIDCFVETMEEVHSWETRYDSVYSVSYEKHILPINERKEIHELINNYLFSGSLGGRLHPGSDDGAVY
jgi:3D (Asp-Asp-Asp) domain-containing protein